MGGVQQGGEVQTISIGEWYLMIKSFFYCNSFPPCSASPTVCHRFMANMTSVLQPSCGTLAEGVGIRVQDGQQSSPLHTHSPVITADSPHLPCLTPLSPALTKPPSALPPSHVLHSPIRIIQIFPLAAF